MAGRRHSGGVDGRLRRANEEAGPSQDRPLHVDLWNQVAAPYGFASQFQVRFVPLVQALDIQTSPCSAERLAAGSAEPLA
jgi:hypothetical protein